MSNFLDCMAAVVVTAVNAVVAAEFAVVAAEFAFRPQLAVFS